MVRVLFCLALAFNLSCSLYQSPGRECLEDGGNCDIVFPQSLELKGCHEQGLMGSQSWEEVEPEIFESIRGSSQHLLAQGERTLTCEFWHFKNPPDLPRGREIFKAILMDPQAGKVLKRWMEVGALPAFSLR